MIQQYTLADFREEAQQYLNEPSDGGLWSIDEMNDYVNTAILRVAMDSRVIQQEVQIPVIPNFALYTLPDDLLVPLWIYTSAQWGQKRLFATTLLQMDKTLHGYSQWEKDGQGHPNNYIPFSVDKFILNPCPNASSYVVLHYSPYPDELVDDTDTTNFPLSAQKCVSIFAAYLAQMKNDVQKAMSFLTEYKTRITKVQEQTRNNEKSRPTVIAPAQRFDKRNANPEVSQWSSGLRGYR